MRDDRFLRALGDIDDSYVDGALEDIKSVPARPVKRILILAACVAVVAATFAVMIPAMMKGKNTVHDDVKGTVVASVPDETEPKETEPKETEIETTPDPRAYEVDLPVFVYAYSWPERSIEELVRDADLIVLTKNIGKEPSYRNEEGTDRHVYTDYLFEVTESYKGDVNPGDTVKVKCTGGEYGGERFLTAEEVEISEGKEYILILTHETDENDELTGSDKYVFFPPKGILAQGGNGKYTALDPSVSYTEDEFVAQIERILG